MCPQDAVVAASDESNFILNCKIAEYTKAVLQDKAHFHISFVMDVSPLCDCHPYNDAPIVPDVGIFASFDPVALDMACADAINKQCAIRNSALGEAELDLGDNLRTTNPNTDWLSAVEHGEKIGLGSKDYELIEI